MTSLEASLESLTVTQDTSQPSPGHNSLPSAQEASITATQPGTSETTLQDNTRQAPAQQTGNQSEQVDECIKNIQCAGNCDHIGCHIVKCEECNFSTDNKKRLESHIKEKHRITCFTCKDTFKTFSEMIEHRRLNHPSTKNVPIFPTVRGENYAFTDMIMMKTMQAQCKQKKTRHIILRMESPVEYVYRSSTIKMK